MFTALPRGRLGPVLLLALALGACGTNDEASVGSLSLGLQSLAIDADGRWVAGDAGGAFVTGDDAGIYPRRGPDLQPVTALLWDGQRYLALDYAVFADLYTNLRDQLLVSADGRDWQVTRLDSIEEFTRLRQGAGRYLAVGMDGGLLVSDDGDNWTVTDSGLDDAFTGLLWDGSRFLASTTSGRVRHSGDGLLWDAPDPAATQALNAVAWDGSGRYVAVGDAGAIVTSDDGDTWQPRASGSDRHLYDIAWGDGRFLAVGYWGTLLTSADGNDWTALDSGTEAVLKRVRWDEQGGRFLVVVLESTVLELSAGSDRPRALAIEGDL